jgi:hypothetical protein
MNDYHLMLRATSRSSGLIYARITFILYNLKALENIDGAASTVECRLGIYVYTTTEVIIASNIAHLPIRKVGQSIGKFRRSVDT